MKVDFPLMLVKGQKMAHPQEKRTTGSPFREAAPAVVVLVSQENRRAGQLGPAGLDEAKQLVRGLIQTLGGQAEDSLAETHRLQGHCLVRLL
jgi:hypothetical protein